MTLVQENLTVVTSRRRCDHCDSNSLDVTIPTLELPEHLKIWSSTAYPPTSPPLRRAGAGRGITAFVKERQITGKTFLTLNEGDMEGYVFFFSLVLLFSSLFCFVST